jgi:hypothetical protein
MMAGEEGFVTPLAGAPRAYGSLGEAVGKIPSAVFRLSTRTVTCSALEDGCALCAASIGGDFSAFRCSGRRAQRTDSLQRAQCA